MKTIVLLALDNISAEAAFSFPVQLWNIGQITKGESEMVGPQNLVHFLSAKFCSFHTRLVHSGCSYFKYFFHFQKYPTIYVSLLGSCSIPVIVTILFIGDVSNCLFQSQSSSSISLSESSPIVGGGGIIPLILSIAPPLSSTT